MEEVVVRECSCGSTCDFMMKRQVKHHGHSHFETVYLHDNFDEWQAWVRVHRPHGIKEISDS